jgi:putative toxin-antitoxin system antitoxin component (TIGR02293 family)
MESVPEARPVAVYDASVLYPAHLRDLLMRLAVGVFESEQEARSWPKRPQMRLGERVPLAVARLEPGARETERLLGRIEHGIPA